MPTMEPAGATKLILRMTGATVFIVSHRPNILTRLDRILVMSGGTISLYGERDRVIAELAAQQAKTQQRVAQPAPGQPPASPPAAPNAAPPAAPAAAPAATTSTGV
jgi:ATP-binding cassette subfamily C protein EexD